MIILVLSLKQDLQPLFLFRQYCNKLGTSNFYRQLRQKLKLQSHSTKLILVSEYYPSVILETSKGSIIIRRKKKERYLAVPFFFNLFLILI